MPHSALTKSSSDNIFVMKKEYVIMIILLKMSAFGFEDDYCLERSFLYFC